MRKIATAHFLIAGTAATVVLGISIDAEGRASHLASERPIIDNEGRVQVIVDFVDDAHMSYPGRLPVLPPAATSNAAPGSAVARDFFHTEKSRALVADYERRFAFSKLGMTSWAGNSVTARLSRQAIERLRDDPLVKQITEDELHQYSAEQINVMPANGWGNSTTNNETTSWGHQAVNGKSYASINNQGIGRKIYIIDSGVALHADLPAMTRLNVSCGTPGSCLASSYPVVGCYGHATHVAGIIGAIANNGKSSRGAYAGFPGMVSLAVTTRTGTLDCGDTAPSTSAIGYALDYIAFDSTQNNPQRLVHIATMSINPGGTNYVNNGSPGPNWYKVRSISTAIWSYGVPVRPGVLFVQSSGNDSSLSDCQRAYKPDYYVDALPEDGVMVVGASHHNGGAVTSGRRFSTFTSPFGGQTNYYPPSPVNAASIVSYGANSPYCIDIWAPGNLIFSTWGIHQSAISNNHTLASVTYGGNIGSPVYGTYDAASTLTPANTTQGWAFLSGTSMAAPFVAAAAAWLADTYGYNASGTLERAVRSNYTKDIRPNSGEVYSPVPVLRLP